MLKNPYGSRVFGHLFDLVDSVMRSALLKTASTPKTSTPSTPSLTRVAVAVINEKRAHSGSFLLEKKRNLFEKRFPHLQKLLERFYCPQQIKINFSHQINSPSFPRVPLSTFSPVVSLYNLSGSERFHQ